jgi:very-short-patch-repair endonuclease
VGASASELCYRRAMRRIDPTLTRHARDLRNASTQAERLLWLRLRQYRPRFTRQLVIAPYIVDLACRAAKLAVEVDGGQHAEATAAYDRRRTTFLQSQGWVVLRLWNSEVLDNPDGAAELILRRCGELLGSTHPRPLPSREGRIRRPRRA